MLWYILSRLRGVRVEFKTRFGDERNFVEWFVCVLICGEVVGSDENEGLVE